jgi:Fe2+ transport system protein B
MKSFYLLAIVFLVFVICEEPGKVPKYKYILKTNLSLTEVQELLAEKGKVKDYKKKYEKKHNKIDEEKIENEIENQIVEENSNNKETNTTVLVSKEEKLSAIKEKSEQKVQAIKDKEEIKEAEIEAKEEKEEANSEAKLEKKEKESEQKDEKKKNKKEAKEAKKEAKKKEKEDKKEEDKESLKKDLVELIQINENTNESLKAPEVTMFSYFFGLIIISCFIGLFVYATQYPKFHQKRINVDNNYLIHNSNEYKKDDDYQNMRDF